MLVAIERGLERALRLIAYVGGAVLVGLVLLVIYEIVMRYFFGRPFRGGFEITELAMSAIVACGLPYAASQRAHVAIDVFSHVLDRPAFRWLNVGVCVLGAAALGLVAWQTSIHALSSMAYGDVTNMMRIPKPPFQFAISISAGLFAVVLAIDSVKTIRGAKPSTGGGA